jgi:hypothetical protein
MLVRISGGMDGIREYLETGRKQGREASREDLDERVILAGNLEVADAVIKSMGGRGEKYLHVTLSFREDNIDREVLLEVARRFEEFSFAAYRNDEYSFYAEAHFPRLKSYVDKASGGTVERKPHLHIVIPKTNLLTGRHLNPFGLVEKNEAYIDAFQESTNASLGLASP